MLVAMQLEKITAKNPLLYICIILVAKIKLKKALKKLTDLCQIYQAHMIFIDKLFYYGRFSYLAAKAWPNARNIST